MTRATTPPPAGAAAMERRQGCGHERCSGGGEETHGGSCTRYGRPPRSSVHERDLRVRPAAVFLAWTSRADRSYSRQGMATRWQDERALVRGAQDGSARCARGAVPAGWGPAHRAGVPGRARRRGCRGHRPGGVPGGRPHPRPLRPSPALRPLAAPHRGQPGHRPGSGPRRTGRDGSRSRRARPRTAPPAAPDEALLASLAGPPPGPARGDRPAPPARVLPGRDRDAARPPARAPSIPGCDADSTQMRRTIMTPELEQHRDPRRGRGRGARRPRRREPRSPRRCRATATRRAARPIAARRGGRRPHRCRAQPAGPRVRRSRAPRGRRSTTPAPPCSRCRLPGGSSSPPAAAPGSRDADGSRRLLGAYDDASWSPFGRYVAATRPNELVDARHRGHRPLDARAARRHGSRAGRAAPPTRGSPTSAATGSTSSQATARATSWPATHRAAGIPPAWSSRPRVHPRLRRHATGASMRSITAKGGSLWTRDASPARRSRSSGRATAGSCSSSRPAGSRSSTAGRGRIVAGEAAPRRRPPWRTGRARTTYAELHRLGGRKPRHARRAHAVQPRRRAPRPDLVAGRTLAPRRLAGIRPVGLHPRRREQDRRRVEHLGPVPLAGVPRGRGLVLRDVGSRTCSSPATRSHAPGSGRRRARSRSTSREALAGDGPGAPLLLRLRLVARRERTRCCSCVTGATISQPRASAPSRSRATRPGRTPPGR